MKTAQLIRAAVFLFAWTLPVFSDPSAESAQATDIAFFTKFAVQLRSIPKREFKKEEANALHLLADKLPDYGEVEDLETALTALMDEAFTSTADLDIINSKRPPSTGNQAQKFSFFWIALARCNMWSKPFQIPRAPQPVLLLSYPA